MLGLAKAELLIRLVGPSFAWLDALLLVCSVGRSLLPLVALSGGGSDGRAGPLFYGIVFWFGL